MANGMPLHFRVAVKPTSSIALPQNSINLATGENVCLKIKGRHDVSIAPRAVPVVEAAAAVALYDLLLGVKKGEEGLEDLRSRLMISDKALLKAFCQRMETVRTISDTKIKHQLPVFDPKREEALLEELLTETPPELKEAVKRLYPEILAISRHFQEKWRNESE